MSQLPSLYETTGLSIAYSDPLIWPFGERRGFIDRVTNETVMYRHTIEAFGGYGRGGFRWMDRRANLEDWLLNGLGRHIETADQDLDVVWEGFVNQVVLQIGGATISRGPLIDLANWVDLWYSFIDSSTDPPTLGDRYNTGSTQNTDSQARYGIWQKILSSGGTIPAAATQIRNTYLQENAWPQTSQQLSVGGGGLEMSVSIDCLGYIHWLEAYVYNQTVSTGLVAIPTKIEAVLAADVNDIISSDYTGIDPAGLNTLQVPRYENEDRTALDVIKGLAAHGDSSSNRWLFGVYADRVAKYWRMPDEIEYQQRFSDPSLMVMDLREAEVKPWDVLPGKWLQFTSVLTGLSGEPVNMRADPRNMFIEAVDFTAPNNLRLTGGKAERLPQKLARLGLAGIGA